MICDFSGGMRSVPAALPPFVGRSIFSLAPAQIASLQRGIQVMMSRPASEPTSHSFQANFHGTYDTATIPQEMQSWNNCEHGSCYFPPWHRMYLYFFDGPDANGEGLCSGVAPWPNVLNFVVDCS